MLSNFRFRYVGGDAVDRDIVFSLTLEAAIQVSDGGGAAVEIFLKTETNNNIEDSARTVAAAAAAAATDARWLVSAIAGRLLNAALHRGSDGTIPRVQAGNGGNGRTGPASTQSSCVRTWCCE